MPKAPPSSAASKSAGSSFSQRIIDKWIAARWALAGIAVIVACFCILPASRLQFDQTLETMFAPSDPLLVPFRQFKRLFGGQEVVLAAYEEPAGLTPATLPRLQELTAKLKAAVPGMQVQSLSNTPLGERILDPTDARSGAVVDMLTNYLISTDRKTVAAICMLPTNEQLYQAAHRYLVLTLPLDMEEPLELKLYHATPANRRHMMVGLIREVIDQYPQGTLAGEPVMLVDGFRTLEQDGLRLEGLCTGLILLTIFLAFRSFRWMLIPLVLVQFTILVTRALLAVGGFQLSMVSSMLSAMITIVGVASIMHLIVLYREEAARGKSPPDALANATRVLFWPICAAVATDMIGFGALLLSHVGPVHDFGLMTALGAGLVLPCGALIIPALALTFARKTPPRGTDPPERLANWLAALWQMLQRHPWRWLGGTALLAIAAVWGSTRLVVETDFTRNFRGDSPLVRSYEFVESRLGGAGVWEILVPVPETLGLGDLDQLRKLETRLRYEVTTHDDDGNSEPGLTKVLSLVDVIDAVSPVPLAGQADNVFTRGGLSAALSLMQLQMPELYAALSAIETVGHKDRADEPLRKQRWLRIMLRAKERQPAEQKQIVIDTVQKICAAEFGRFTFNHSPSYAAVSNAASQPITAAPTIQVTGFFVLLANLIESLLADQWLMFAASTGGIALLLLIGFRSLRLAIIATIPNVLSNVIMLGTLGWLGLRINMGTVMIAAVSMGLSVDSSIHFLIAYRRERRAGKSVSAAIESVERGTGQAMVWAGLSLVVGYSALTASQFVPTIYFGALSGLTMLGGMLGNLIVLPLLVYITEAGRGKRS